MIKSKYGQIGAGITWFVAFLIIFFIIILFISASLFLAGRKNVPVLGEGQGNIEIDKESGDIVSAEMLSSILETKSNEVALKNTILKWEKARADEKDAIKNEIEISLKEILELYQNCQYIFYIDSWVNLEKDAAGARGNYLDVAFYRIKESNIHVMQEELYLKLASGLIIGKGERGDIEAKFYLRC